MVRTTSFVLGLVFSVAGCSKKEGSAPASAQSATPLAVSSASPLASSAPSAAPPAVAPATAMTASSEAPSSFAGGNKENVDGAVGQGCEARSSQGWLELLCRKKNGTGGHPVKAILDAENNEEVLADEQGELKLTVPFGADASKDVKIEWTDTSYVLHVKGASAKLEWASGGLELRRACAKVQDESKARVSEAQKAPAPNALSAAEAAKLPRFGVCQQAGFGSFAVALKGLSAEGEASERKLRAALSLVFVGADGSRKSGDFGSFEFAPGGLSLLPARVYDYDDDGKDELIVPYEHTPPSDAAAAAAPAAIWSLSDSGIVPYAKSPSIGVGGFAIEQLDFDMRPDLGDFGPFVATLGSNCGAKSCPPRVSGPRFFYHSLPDGGFSRNDAAALGALKRACSKKPEPLLVEAAGSVNVSQTGKNIACALGWGVPAATISAELASKKALLCASSESCPLLATFETWAGAAPPATLTP
ncbi:MAG: hypothetical protein QM756_39525 [Polyangiaceae bacterium]